MIDTVTTEELAERLKIKPATLRGWARRRIIPCIRITPGCVRFDVEAVERALAERQLSDQPGDQQ